MDITIRTAIPTTDHIGITAAITGLTIGTVGTAIIATIAIITIIGTKRG
jgi:hypothetical protein